MKRIIIYYFSGTGNTKLIAELYKKYFSECEVTLHRITMKDGELVEYPSPSDFDIVGLGFPIYGFNSPEPVYKFAKALPKIDGGANSGNGNESGGDIANGADILGTRGDAKKPTFIFRNGGEGTKYNSYAAQKIIRVLGKKGYDVLTDELFVMPYNMVFRHSPQMVKSEFIYADAMVRLNIKEILGGVRQKVRRCPLKYWFVPIVRLVWPYAKFQGKFVMRADNKKCVKCNSCVKNCPLGNIRFDQKKGKYVWGANCALCVACSFNCPKNAISLGVLNPWRINGSYHIEQTAADKEIEFPHFGENLKGLMRFLYYKYYRRCDKRLQEAGIELNGLAQN